MLLKVVVIFVIGLVGTMFMVWFERKVIAGMQNRIGPNKAGPFGLLQTLADGIKLFFKEDLLPDSADRFVFRLAPFLAFVPAFLVWSVIPLGGDFSDGKDGIVDVVRPRDPRAAGRPADRHPARARAQLDRRLRHHARRLGVGLEVPAARRRCGHRRRWSLRGGARAERRRRAADRRARCRTTASSTAQDGITDWNIVATGFVPFVIFLIAATAELNRPPFDLVEAEQELVGGFNTEYSAIRFALFFLAEFMNVITMSGVIVTLFLGGPQPLIDRRLDFDVLIRSSGRPRAARSGSCSRCSCSSTCTCGSGPRCPACATTS